MSISLKLRDRCFTHTCTHTHTYTHTRMHIHTYIHTYIHTAGASTIVTPPTNQTVRVGDAFSLLCEVQGYPPPTVMWYQDGLLLDPSFLSGVEYSNNRLTFDQASDDFFGLYTCVATNVHERVVSDPASVVVLCKLL